MTLCLQYTEFVQIVFNIYFNSSAAIYSLLLYYYVQSEELQVCVYVFLELDSVCTGPMLTAWLDPPVVPQLHIHLFNITNPQEVLVHLLPKYRMIA
jgi:hypothetical protein